MEIKILEDTKEKLVFELHGEDHTLCNLVIKKLKDYPEVKYAAYSIEHPLVGIPKILVEGKNPRASIKKAIDELNETANEFKKLVSKI